MLVSIFENANNVKEGQKLYKVPILSLNQEVIAVAPQDFLRIMEDNQNDKYR